MSTTPDSEPFLFAPSTAGTFVSGDSGSRSLPAGMADPASDANSTPASAQKGGHPVGGEATAASSRPDAVPSGSDLVNQARQEITQILRELAAARSKITDRQKYLRFLADRTLRAMAAQGIIIWQVPEPDAVGIHSSPSDSAVTTKPSAGTADTKHEQAKPKVTVAHRLGSLTDLTWTNSQQQVHSQLLADVLADGQPVVVPPTPGADQPDTPANPTEAPAALVPVSLDPQSQYPEWLLEVFLEPHGTPASWRGALRFLAQVGDLAGEALRAEKMRRQSQQLQWVHRVDSFLDSIRRLSRTVDIEAAWADAIAECIPSNRVALCVMEGKRVRLAAVGFVSQIDQRGDAADAIREAAKQSLSHTDLLATTSIENPNSLPSAEQVDTAPAWVIATRPDSVWRLVVSAIGSDDPVSEPKPAEETKNAGLDEITAAAIQRLLIGGEHAWNAAARIESLPGGRWWSRRQSDRSEPTAISQVLVRSRRRRQRWVAWTASVLIAAAFFVPVPNVVTAPGIIRPAESSAYHAPLDAVVDELHVEHGQQVQAGDPLVTLKSADLRERKISLQGRRAVLEQQRQRWKESLVRQGASGSIADDAVGREVEEELASIDSQLAIVAETQDSLRLRARHAGRVDAWRIQETLDGRPLRRGDLILRIIDEQSLWVVDARIPQQRVATVENAIREERFHAETACTFAPEQTCNSVVRRFGPVKMNPLDQLPTATLRLELQPLPATTKAVETGTIEQPFLFGRDRADDSSQEVVAPINGPKLAGLQSEDQNSAGNFDRAIHAETPARVTIRCGRIPFGWFLIEDVVAWCRTRVGAYFE